MTTGEVLGNLRTDTKSLHDGLSIPGVAKRGEYHLHAGDSGRRPPEPPSWPRYLKDEKKYQYAISAFVGGAVSLESIRSESGEIIGMAVNTDPQPTPESTSRFDVAFNNRLPQEVAEQLEAIEVGDAKFVIGALRQMPERELVAA